MTLEDSKEKTQDVRRRQVFYIPGYDPMLPRRYRELYRKEGRKQAEISGYHIELKSLSTSENYAWQVDSQIGDRQTHTEFEFLLWSDIVQGSMDRSIPGTFLLLVRVVWVYISSGALRGLMRLRKGPVIAALYPIFMLLMQLFLSIILAGLVIAGASVFLPDGIGLILGILALVFAMRGFRRLDNRLFAYYLLHDYAFSAENLGKNAPELVTRMSQFARRIREALESDVDEVLVVGHSSGAHLGVSVLAELFRDGEVPENGPFLSFLTLGQVVPMVSFLSEATQLRQDLYELCQRSTLTWVDVTAPGDGCTFALCDPVSVSGANPGATKKWPLVISAAFSQTLSPAMLKSLKWRFFRLHFQYLCAFDQPGDYDYFQITAGPISLGARYRGRSPSPSCKTEAVSPYQSRKVQQRLL